VVRQLRKIFFPGLAGATHADHGASFFLPAEFRSPDLAGNGHLPGSQNPGGVSPLLCTGVSSLYCAYTVKSRNCLYGKSAGFARPKFAFPPDEIAAVLAMFRRQGELFHPGGSPAASVDLGDTKFLQCAEAAQADYLVTGNKRHFPEPAYGVTSIVSAGELLDRITLEI
jgi:hypothetical protein